MCFGLEELDNILMHVSDPAMGGARVTHVQVFGERRSGTNYLETLIGRNFRVRPVQSYGWKHGFPSMPVISPQALLIVSVRDPLDWLVSFYSTPLGVAPHLKGLSFSSFIRTEWDSLALFGRNWKRFGYHADRSLRHGITQLDRHPVEGRRFANVLEMRRVKLAAQCGLVHRGQAAVVRYEDVRDRPEAVIAALGARFDLGRRGRFRPVPAEVGPRSGPRKMTRAAIGADDRAFIAETLDRAAEAALGYDLNG